MTDTPADGEPADLRPTNGSQRPWFPRGYKMDNAGDVSSLFFKVHILGNAGIAQPPDHEPG